MIIKLNKKQYYDLILCLSVYKAISSVKRHKNKCIKLIDVLKGSCEPIHNNKKGVEI